MVNNNIEIQSLIVSEARRWLGTPFHHQGRRKHVGVDCLGLLVGVAEELDIRACDGSSLVKHDEVLYSHTPDSKRLMSKLRTLLCSVPIAELQPGDIGLFAIDGYPQHMGVIVEREQSAESRGRDAVIPNDVLASEEFPEILPALRAVQNDICYAFNLIHAYAPARKVVEHVLDDWWKDRIVAGFRVSR